MGEVSLRHKRLECIAYLDDVEVAWLVESVSYVIVDGVEVVVNRWLSVAQL